MVTIRRLEILVLTAIVVVLLLLFAGRTGSRSYFSPETLETKYHSLYGYVGVSLPGTAHTYRHELTEYLISKGHWKASGTNEPQWLSTYTWDTGSRGGYSLIGRHLFRKDNDWIAWSERHPQRAAVFWPHVLVMLREEGERGQSTVAQMLYDVQHAQTDAEFEAALRGNTNQH